MSEVLIPNTSLHDVASYQLLVNDTAVDASFQLLSLSVTKEMNRIPFARLVFRDGEAAEKSFAISNDAVFVPGKKIKIKIGRDGNNAQVFQGIITRHAIRIRENGNSELHVECRDEAVRMSLVRHSRYYQQLKDSDLFDELIGAYSGLAGDFQSTTLQHKELVQHHISDWDFMLLRAEANGMLVYVQDGTIRIAKPDTSRNPALQVSFGSSVLEFEAEMDARNQWKTVKAASWDYSNQQLFHADVSAADGFAENGNIPGDELASAVDAAYELHHSGHLLEQELQSWVEGTMLRSRLAKIRGRVKVEGFAAIQPGDMVKLDGVGDRFKGNALVTGVRQDMGNGIWETQIQFGLQPDYHAQLYKDVSDMQTSGLVGAINGLQIGKVVKLENDPDGNNRIMVKIPTIDNDAQGIWTRVATLDAGNNRGSFFLPEIDDEVILGFINDDPRHPVILGMLHSSAKPAPITAEDSNDKKGFTTRSQMHISFNDATKTITIDTPAGNSITLDESSSKIEIKDQNSNTVTMGTSGISLSSPLNIEIKAGANLTLSAGASLTIGGMSVAVKADADASLQGAMTTLSAQGIASITGSLVKIN
jgi:Rhs element Vgr protein